MSRRSRRHDNGGETILKAIPQGELFLRDDYKAG
jgi:hypothetical protein